MPVRKVPFQTLLCQFGPGGKLFKSTMILAKTKFVAISHVWGNVEWREVRGIEGEVLLSEEKAKFLEEQLPLLIGQGWFWMDILCIDQKNESARIAITQHIPIIFRSAYKTLAVRESSGFKYCCSLAREDIRAYLGGETIRGVRLHDHYKIHPNHIPRRDEGFLSRIWTLQEIVLSDNIQFICSAPVICGEMEIGLRSPDLDSSLIAFKDLRALADSWSQVATEPGWFFNPPQDVMKFMFAFLEDGSVSRQRTTKPSRCTLNIYYIWDHMDSVRRATKPRDYILALMPQFEWYSTPANAKQMTFGELFLNCCIQAKDHDVKDIGPLINAGRLKVDELLRGQATANIPTPTCFGELIMLFSGTWWRAELTPMSFGKAVIDRITVHQVYDAISAAELHSIILESMEFSITCWTTLFYMKGGSQISAGWIEDEEFIYMNVFRTIYELRKNPVDLRMRAAWRRIRSWLNNDVRKIHIDSLIYLTAMISCGLGISAFEWTLYNMTPLLITYHGTRLLTLAPITLFENDKSYMSECEFGLIEVANAAIMFALDSGDSLCTRCLFPFDDKRINARWREVYSLMELENNRDQSTLNKIISQVLGRKRNSSN
jgi:Heterokaryon incompatibility protein (HET)